tara:strand:+ start:17324 stop:17446 length:123 start_codon:yes stop_codon:yes gene_type:complete
MEQKIATDETGGEEEAVIMNPNRAKFKQDTVKVPLQMGDH